MKTKKSILVGIPVVGLLIASWAAAQESSQTLDRPDEVGRYGECREDGYGPGRRFGGAPEDGFRGLRGIRSLNLSAAQRAQIDKIIATANRAAEPLYAEIYGLREKMRAQWQQQAPSKKNILDLHKKINGVTDKLAEQRIAARLEMIAVLTPAQRTEMIQRQADRGFRDGRGDGRGRGRGKGRGKGFSQRGHDPNAAAPGKAATPRNSRRHTAQTAA